MILEIKKMCSEMMIWNSFLSYGFFISETHFAYGTLIPESSKIIKDNSGITKNVGGRKKM